MADVETLKRNARDRLAQVDPIYVDAAEGAINLDETVVEVLVDYSIIGEGEPLDALVARARRVARLLVHQAAARDSSRSAVAHPSKVEIRMHRQGPMPIGEQIDGGSALVMWRHWLDERLDEGARCPCCGQHAQVYRRKLNATMVRCLAALHAAGGSSGYVHAPTALADYGLKNVGGDVGKLALFGLVWEDDRKREDGGRAGYWRVSSDGYRFLVGEHEVDRFALVYNGERIGTDGPRVVVTEVAPDFSLRDLLAGI